MQVFRLSNAIGAVSRARSTSSQNVAGPSWSAR
ncbi:UNVERIFIED_CONTAM: hypothetical protein GTU68_035570 [Idotea baltica]|nr:hypothetical protein [Idotea baltica]